MMADAADRGKARILFYHANNSDVGGSDFCLAKMVTQLDRRRFDPIVFLRLETRVCEIYRAHGVEFLVRPVVRLSRGRGLTYWLRLVPDTVRTVRMVMDIVRTRRVDIVHSNDLLDFLGALGGRLGGAATIQHVRMFPPAGILGRLIRTLVIRLNARVLCVSNAICQAMGGPDNALVYYDWIDPARVGHAGGDGASLRRELGVTPKQQLVGVVGRLEPWKGQHLLIEAAPRILAQNPNVVFWIVGGEVSGKGAYAAELRRMVERKGLASNMRFLGERTDVMAIMGACDLVAHTSVEPDPLPGVVMEAGFAGKIVVGPKAGGVPEEVAPSNHWALYARGDSEALAQAVIRALGRADLETAGLAARRFVESTFSAAPLGRLLEDTYLKLIES